MPHVPFWSPAEEATAKPATGMQSIGGLEGLELLRGRPCREDGSNRRRSALEASHGLELLHIDAGCHVEVALGAAEDRELANSLLVHGVARGGHAAHRAEQPGGVQGLFERALLLGHHPPAPHERMNPKVRARSHGQQHSDNSALSRFKLLNACLAAFS
eukprot:2263980-Alexandrium_andersonii.AAC.1